MTVWIGLLRGINVGGKNKMPMARLTSLLESIDCGNVRTYIQSGNVVFDSAQKSKANLQEKILDAIEESFEFRPGLMLLTPKEFGAAVKNNPFQEAVDSPSTLHFFFLEAAPANKDAEVEIKASATKTERFALKGKVFYLHAPDGIGRSKLAASVEKKLGVPVTARNYNTVSALTALLAS